MGMQPAQLLTAEWRLNSCVCRNCGKIYLHRRESPMPRVREMLNLSARHTKTKLHPWVSWCPVVPCMSSSSCCNSYWPRSGSWSSARIPQSAIFMIWQLTLGWFLMNNIPKIRIDRSLRLTYSDLFYFSSPFHTLFYWICKLVLNSCELRAKSACGRPINERRLYSSGIMAIWLPGRQKLWSMSSDGGTSVANAHLLRPPYTPP